MDINWLWWFIVAALVIAGFAGMLLPALPGAPLLFAGLWLAAWIEDYEFVGVPTLVLLAALTAFTYIVDFIAGAFGAKRFGASKWSVIGATLGAIIGIFFGIPGVLFGPFVGAVTGELLVQRNLLAVSKAGVGASLGLIIGTAAKLALAFSMLGIFAVARFV